MFDLTVAERIERFFPLWWRCFLFTLAVELPIYVWLARRIVPAWRAAAAGTACSSVTHPLLWFVWPIFFHSKNAYVVSGELIVCGMETVIFYFLARLGSWRRAFLASLLANAASFFLGVVAQPLGILG